VKRLVLAIAVLATAGVSFVLPAAEERLPAQLTVTAVRGVPDLERLMIEREILRRIEARNCGLRLPRPEEAPAWRIEVALLYWRESESPGGVPVFDPRSGSYLPGRRRDIETVYSLRVYRSESPPPPDVPAKQHPLRVHAETKPTAAYEPREHASRMLREQLAEEVRNGVCRAVRD
jgi:hypothetical protein